ncbi:MAG: DUF6531 domain-containing protein, partial [Methylobacter sp.]
MGNTLAFLIGLVVITPSYALTPMVKYWGYDTALEAEYVFYNSWIASYGKVGCSFSELTWIDTPTAVNGYVPFSQTCGYGHVLPVVISKVFVCPARSNYDQLTRNCELPPKSNGGGSDNSSECSKGNNVNFGNPINAGTGNKWQHETDLPSGAFGLTFDRYYNASTTSNSSNLGAGWTHAYIRSSSVQSSGTSVTIRRNDGKEYNFSQS